MSSTPLTALLEHGMIDLNEPMPQGKFLSLLIHKWVGRGFFAWIISALLFQFTFIELVIATIPLFIFIFWMIYIEWKRYNKMIKKYYKDRNRG